jgi:hypothetical protein
LLLVFLVGSDLLQGPFCGRSEGATDATGAPDAERSTRSSTVGSEGSDSEDSDGSEDLDSDSEDSEDSEGGEAPPSWGACPPTAETLARDEEIGKALRAEQARIEAQNEAKWAQEALRKAKEARRSPDLRRVFTKYELTESHGVNQANLVECIRRVRAQITNDGVLTVERSADLCLLKAAMHEDLL